MIFVNNDDVMGKISDICGSGRISPWKNLHSVLDYQYLL